MHWTFSRPDEFESFKIGESTIITFCMRELRAILNFAESMNTGISANFDTAGKWVMCIAKAISISLFYIIVWYFQTRGICDKGF